MKLETLHLLSVGLVFIGFLCAAIGGFGAFHFGQLLERSEDRKQLAAVEQLAQVVSTLQQEQHGLSERLTSVEKPASETAAPLAVAAPILPPPPSFIAPPPPSPAAIPALAVPPPPAPDILRPQLPPIAQGPAVEAEPEAPAIKPPKLVLGPRPKPPALEAEQEDGPLGAAQRSRFIRQLRTRTSQNLSIRVAAENARALKTALALKSAFREAGWGVGELEMTHEPIPAHTVVLSTGAFPPPKEFVIAYSALERAGFLVSSDLDPNQGSQRVAIAIGPMR